MEHYIYYTLAHSLLGVLCGAPCAMCQFQHQAQLPTAAPTHVQQPA
jgi:hypothetical protein